MQTIDILVLIDLILFYVLFIGRTVMLYKKGVKVWVIGKSTKKAFEIILENILFPVLTVWSVFIVLTALHIPLPGIISNYVLRVSWIQYAGIALCYLGIIIFLLALLSFGKAWRIGIDKDNSNDLITSGIFKYSRNPIFLFMDLYFVGIMLIYPNIIFVLVAIGAVIGIHLQILREEKYLSQKFGEKYSAYKKYTRRYF
ncbi:MAG: isoprenylcysteine carboxylmethyltransferase family protein [Treponema sp.]|jgi:protein-S-isoprenylcysteine O-methyltransferase Ste14|nr:isoprenylcysteine carboxylmethyltransferase family protein [Treponema sp.]